MSNQAVMSNVIQMSLPHCPVLTHWRGATRTLILESRLWAEIHPAQKSLVGTCMQACLYEQSKEAHSAVLNSSGFDKVGVL